MGRHPKPIPQNAPGRRVAVYLRQVIATAGLTYAEIAGHQQTVRSAVAATLDGRLTTWPTIVHLLEAIGDAAVAAGVQDELPPELRGQTRALWQTCRITINPSLYVERPDESDPVASAVDGELNPTRKVRQMLRQLVSRKGIRYDHPALVQVAQGREVTTFVREALHGERDLTSDLVGAIAAAAGVPPSGFGELLGGATAGTPDQPQTTSTGHSAHIPGSRRSEDNNVAVC